MPFFASTRAAVMRASSSTFGGVRVGEGEAKVRVRVSVKGESE